MSLQPEDLQNEDISDSKPVRKLELKSINMKKILLSLASLVALKFDKETPEVEVEVVEAAILKLSTENTALRAKVLAHETAQEVAQEAEISEMVTLAITEGRIPATKKDDFVNLAKSNLELAKNTIAMLPKKVSLAADIVPGQNAGVTTKEDFLKLSHQEQLAFKTTNADEYKKLFTKNK